MLILLAEDNPVNQLVVAGLLENQGHTLVLAANGREAVEQFKARRPDLVLIDRQMPLLDGLGAARKIRALESGESRVPIILITADALSPDAARCLFPEVDAYLAKPLPREKLLETIAACAKGAQGPADPGTILLKNFGGDAALFTRAAWLFATTTPGYLDKIRDGIAARDVASILEAVSFLLGSLQVFEADRAVNIVEILRESARGGDFKAAALFYTKLKLEASLFTSKLALISHTLKAANSKLADRENKLD